jgi:hypothetical protein
MPVHAKGRRFESVSRVAADHTRDEVPHSLSRPAAAIPERTTPLQSLRCTAAVIVVRFSRLDEGGKGFLETGEWQCRSDSACARSVSCWSRASA